MTGLQKTLKIYGRMKVHNVYWVWDYKNNKPRLEKEMTKEEISESEKAKWEEVRKIMNK
jgi:hypothetical protein